MRGFGRKMAAVALIAAVSGYGLAAVAHGAGGERIALVAAKFKFSQSEIHVKKGRPVTIALTSPDFVHGFGVPDFNVRIDAVPGKTVELTFTPGRSGRFAFLCDNFCGEGHDQMSGFLVVTD